MKHAPVVLLGYARPNETKQIIERINMSKTKKVYFFVDFPNNTNDSKLVRFNNEVKALVSSFNKNIDVEPFFFEKNVGPFEAINRSTEYVFVREEELIYLEDDKLPSVSFFEYCSNLLEKYRHDERILFISGLNNSSLIYEDYPYDYFFAEINSTWGHATWKRTYDKFNYAFEFFKIKYYKNLINETYKFKGIKHDVLSEIESYLEYGKYKGHVASQEFYMLGPLRFLTNSIVIVPSKNLISNTGATEYTFHGDEYKLMTRRQRKIFFREVFELDFPLKHPPFVMTDFRFTKANNNFLTKSLLFFEKIERSFLIIKHKGLKGLIDKIKIKIKILKNEEY